MDNIFITQKLELQLLIYLMKDG